jgi:hypothetical protein
MRIAVLLPLSPHPSRVITCLPSFQWIRQPADTV